MRNAFIFVFILCLNISCSNQKTQQVPLFNGYSFQLAAGEGIVQADSATTKSYNNLYNAQPGIQIPLLKFIHHKDYKIYIGIPYNTPFKRIAARKSPLNANPAIFNCDTANCIMKYLHNGQNQTEYLLRIPGQKTLFYVVATTNSLILHNNLFTAANLKKRFVFSN